MSEQTPRPRRRLITILANLLSELQDVSVGVYAANASFFIILSVFPMLVLLLAILNLTRLTETDLVELLSTVLPTALQGYVSTVVTDLKGFGGAAVISITAVLAIWSASRGVYGVMVGINAIFHCRDRRNYLLRRLICILYTLFLILSLLVTLALHVFGRNLLALLAKLLPALGARLGQLNLLRLLFTLAFLTLIFTAVYTSFPSRRVSLRACLIAAFSAAMVWMAFSSVFSVIVTHSTNYTTFYGSLTMVAVFMLWLYTCMTILLLGGALASVLSPGRNKR